DIISHPEASHCLALQGPSPSPPFLYDHWSLWRSHGFYLLTKDNGENFGFRYVRRWGTRGTSSGRLCGGGDGPPQGLQDGDRILEVNGEYVVQKIKASGNQVAVAVLDGNAYEVAKALDKNLAELLPGHTGTRLCHVVKDKSGFGLHISAQEGKRKVKTLPVGGKRAGLKEGDVVIEVNGRNVEQASYERLKQSGSKVTLLVIDAKSEEFYRLQGVRVIAAMADATTLPFKARKLHMVKGPDGYGFLLKEEKCSSGMMGQFLSEVDTGLPADRAGMRDGDRLLAVNGEGVEGLCHQEVVDMIRAGGNQVTLLVIDPDGDKFYSSVCPDRIVAQCEGWWAAGRDANPALWEQQPHRNSSLGTLCHSVLGLGHYMLMAMWDVKIEASGMLSSGSGPQELGGSACLVFQIGLSPLLFCEDGHPSSGTHTTPGSHPSMPQGNGMPVGTPRLCHLDMGPEGYRFQLQTVADKPGVFITQVTPLNAPCLSAKGGPDDPRQPQTPTHGAQRLQMALSSGMVGSQGSGSLPSTPLL
uniref:NHERF family PDZ scaffold protein 4 n=1 Tax=Chelonoidis abingdonii TaxID=106734 RepID=A0A8C0GTZ3_CHEAB